MRTLVPHPSASVWRKARPRNGWTLTCVVLLCALCGSLAWLLEGVADVGHRPHMCSVKLPPVISGDREQTMAHTFELVNNTSHPVALRDVWTSCSCTQATLANRSLRPQESTTLSVVGRPRVQGGENFAKCTVKAECGCSWIFELRSTSYPRVQVLPGAQVLDLGSADPGTGCTQRVDVVEYVLSVDSLSAEPILTCTSPFVVVTLPKVTDDALSDDMKRRVTSFLLTVDTLAPPGRHSAEMAVVVPGVRAEPISRGVAFTIRSLYDVSPAERIYLGRLRSSDPPITRDVKIRRLDGRPLRDCTARASHPGIVATVRDDESDASAITVRIEIDPARFEASFHEEVVIDTKDEVQPALPIVVSALIRP